MRELVGWAVWTHGGEAAENAVVSQEPAISGCDAPHHASILRGLDPAFIGTESGPGVGGDFEITMIVGLVAVETV